MDGFTILFLGTCACDFSPRLQTDCKDRFDKDVRRSSSILIDGHILVDCGPHTLNSLEIIKKPLRGITDIFLTHLHSDHFDAANIQKIAEAKGEKLRLWVRADACMPQFENVEVIRMEPGREYAAGDGIAVTSLEANHTDFPQHFIFEKAGKKIFYGLDGAWVLNESFRKMRGRCFDLLILDCTMGDYDGDLRISEHNSIPMVRMLLKSFATVGVTGQNSRVYLSHLAPSLHKPHTETEKICAQFGAQVAYDGLVLKV